MKHQGLTVRRGFTLVEMLIVISIIMILAGLGLAALVSMNVSAKERAAKADLVRIRTAIEQYWTLYHRFPVNPTRDAAGEGATAMEPAEILKMLVYQDGPDGDPDTNKLPRGSLMEFKERKLDSDGNLLDPWGHPYYVFIDEDAAENNGRGDGFWDVRKNPDGSPLSLKKVRTAVEVYSFGDDEVSDHGHNADDGHSAADHDGISEISDPYDDLKP